MGKGKRPAQLSCSSPGVSCCHRPVSGWAPVSTIKWSVRLHGISFQETRSLSGQQQASTFSSSQHGIPGQFQSPGVHCVNGLTAKGREHSISKISTGPLGGLHFLPPSWSLSQDRGLCIPFFFPYLPSILINNT